MGTFSIWHWLVVLLVVVLVFGSGKLADIGSNVGKAIRGYQKSMRDGAKEETAADAKQDATALEAREQPPAAAAPASTAASTEKAAAA